MNQSIDALTIVVTARTFSTLSSLSTPCPLLGRVSPFSVRVAEEKIRHLEAESQGLLAAAEFREREACSIQEGVDLAEERAHAHEKALASALEQARGRLGHPCCDVIVMHALGVRRCTYAKLDSWGSSHIDRSGIQVVVTITVKEGTEVSPKKVENTHRNEP